MANPLKIHLQEKFEHRVVHGLYCEWENTLWLLPSHLRRKMKKPLLGIRDLKNQHACWSPEHREITLSRNLVMHHGWDTVIEVLRHEMAHQLADEVMGGAGHLAHGDVFKKACYLLRANPKASGQYPLLHHRLKQDAGSGQDKILQKVKKLMALAESKNLNEAQSAASKAHELIEKYNIDLIRQHKKRTFHSIFLGRPGLRHFREVHHLAHLLQEFYFVDVMWISAYVIEKSKMGRVLEISGIDKNLTIAAYVHDYMNQYIDIAWMSYNKDKKLNRYRKTDFAIGIITGFYDKLKTHKTGPCKTDNRKSLIPIKDHKLSDYMHYRYPSTRSVRRTSVNRDEGVVASGFDLGKKLVIAKGIAESGAPGLMIDQ